MINWKQITGFDCDPGNERKSAEKHAVYQFEAEQVFFNQTLLVLADQNQNQNHSQTEARYHALGKNDEGRLLHITFTLRSDDLLIRVISARDMHRKERNIYEQS
jgi:uncharacterized DUF497 family protein